MKKIYTKGHIDESTLRKTYLKLVYNEKLSLIRGCVREKIYFILYETTNSCNRSAKNRLGDKLNSLPSKVM